MKNMKLGLLFTTAALAFATGCGEIIGGSDGGSEGAACSSDDNCATGLACHPGLNECRYTCTGDSECPTSEKHCAAISADADAGTGALFCGCTPFTDNSLCETADSATPFCNYQTHTCSASQGTAPGPAACTTTDPQPSSCGYGSECDSTGHCASITADTCANFTAASTWSSASTGPVIFAAAGATPSSSGTPNDATFCTTTSFVHRYDLQIYRTDRDWDSSGATEQDKLTYFDSTGAQTTFTIGTNMRASSYVANGKILNYRVVMCSSSATAFTAGFRFTGGNEACVSGVAGIAGTTP